LTGMLKNNAVPELRLEDHFDLIGNFH